MAQKALHCVSVPGPWDAGLCQVQRPRSVSLLAATCESPVLGDLSLVIAYGTLHLRTSNRPEHPFHTVAFSDVPFVALLLFFSFAMSSFCSHVIPF